MRNTQRQSQPRLWWLLGWFYEGLFALVPHRELVRSTALDLKRSDSVLDAGCGTGRLGLQARSRRMIGVDFSASMLRWAKRRNHGVVQADLTNLPLADGVFDVIVSLNVLYAVSDVATTLSELHRVTRNGGQLRVATPVSSALWPLVREHFRTATLIDHVRFAVNLPRIVGWVLILALRGLVGGDDFVFYPEEELILLCKEAGWRIVSCEPCYAGIDRFITAIKEDAC